MRHQEQRRTGADRHGGDEAADGRAAGAREQTRVLGPAWRLQRRPGTCVSSFCQDQVSNSRCPRSFWAFFFSLHPQLQLPPKMLITLECLRIKQWKGNRWTRSNSYIELDPG